MNDRELLKMALETLERIAVLVPKYDPQVSDAIATLRERLAQPEQKPVAWMYTSQREGNERFITRYQSELTTYKADKVWPLYTAPQPAQEPEQKPLTDEQLFEMAEIAWRHGWASCRDAEYVGADAENQRWGEVGVEVAQDIKSVYVRC